MGLQSGGRAYRVRSPPPARCERDRLRSRRVGARPGTERPDRVTDARRYRLDDLRRFATALASALGVAPARASALATHLLWFDAAGVPRFGLGSLPGRLEAIESGAVDPAAAGVVTLERSGTAVFDARRGLPLLALDRAAGIAVEKARDVGVGLVRVVNVGDPGSAAGVAAEAAIGPVSVTVLGPGPSWTVALPGDEGLPVVYDTALAGADGARPSAEALDGLPPWISALLPAGGWLVLAASVTATESLTTFQARVSEAFKGRDDPPGRLGPRRWEDRRREARERGVASDPARWDDLLGWAERLKVTPPATAAQPAPSQSQPEPRPV